MGIGYRYSDGGLSLQEVGSESARDCEVEDEGDSKSEEEEELVNKLENAVEGKIEIEEGRFGNDRDLDSLGTSSGRVVQSEELKQTKDTREVESSRDLSRRFVDEIRKVK